MCLRTPGRPDRRQKTVTVASNSDVTFQGVDTTNSGPYTQTAGTTTIDAGGTLTASEVDIQGGLLTGGGVIFGDLTVEDGGTVSPGDPQSLAIIGDYTQVLSGIMDLDLVVPDPNNLAGTQSDQIFVLLNKRNRTGGNLTLGGTLDLTLEGGIDNFNPGLGTIFNIITWFTSENGNFNTFNDPVFDHGTETFQEVFVGQSDGNGGYTGRGQLELLVTSAATPEPSTLAMLFGAVLLAAGVLWRRRRSSVNGIE